MNKSLRTDHVQSFKTSQHFSQQGFNYKQQSNIKQFNSNINSLSQGIYTIKVTSQLAKTLLFIRHNLVMEYIPQFRIIQDKNDIFKVKIKQYPQLLLPWLSKQDSLFKINVLLGLFLAFLELFSIYGYFQIRQNLMKLSQDQQIAIWINKNFMLNQPQNNLNPQENCQKKFIQQFSLIFKSFILIKKKQPRKCETTSQYIALLLSIKKRQQMHRNCHQFLKVNCKMAASRKSINTLIPMCANLDQRFSMNPSSNVLNQRSFQQKRLSQRAMILQKQNISRKTLNSDINIQPHQSIAKSISHCQFNTKLKPAYSKINLQKKTSLQKNIQRSQNKQSLSSKGQLFKKYLLYNTSKFHKKNKINSQLQYNNSYQKSKKQDKSKIFIFRSQVIDNNFNFKSSQGSHGPFNFQKSFNSKQKITYQPVRVRKFSGNSEQGKKNSQKIKFQESQKNLQSCSSQGHFFGSNRNKNSQSRQKLKHSFPYKTSSTFNSIRNSNNHLYHGVNGAEEHALFLSGKNNKVEQLEILQQNQVQNDLNNIFSVQGSNITHPSEADRKMDQILTQFQSVIF